MSVDEFNVYLEAIHALKPWFIPTFLMVFGGVFGSFITCALYRVPRGLSMRSPGSMCPSCEQRLGVVDLVPICSYVFSGGKCRHCGVKIPPRYVLLELLCVLSAAVSFLVFGAQVVAFILFIALLCLVYMVWGWFESRHLAYKVLPFFIILLLLLFLLCS